MFLTLCVLAVSIMASADDSGKPGGKPVESSLLEDMETAETAGGYKKGGGGGYRGGGGHYGGGHHGGGHYGGGHYGGGGGKYGGFKKG